MIIVTSGADYIDIDAYASCVAYAELLNLQGNEAQALSTAVWNESITDTIRSWQADLATDYIPHESDSFALIDLSDPAQFDHSVDPEHIINVIDHHAGFEHYWRDKLGENSDIASVGAAATQIFERFKRANLLSHISKTTARLLVTAILDNTLHFTANVTTERDRNAYAELLVYADLPIDWPSTYFNECQRAIMKDLPAAIRNDAKTVSLPGLAEPLHFGQLVVWNAGEIRTRHLHEITALLAQTSSYSILNLVSIEEGISYFISNNPTLKKWLTELVNVTFENTLARANRLWLRKEVIKRSLDTQLKN